MGFTQYLHGWLDGIFGIIALIRRLTRKYDEDEDLEEE